jgi:hypothetical protein
VTVVSRTAGQTTTETPSDRRPTRRADPRRRRVN